MNEPTWEERRQAFTTLIGIVIEPENEIQKRAWEEEQRIVCPHGNTDWQHNELDIHYRRNATDDGETHDGEVDVDGHFEWSGEGEYFQWLECYCDIPNPNFGKPWPPAYEKEGLDTREKVCDAKAWAIPNYIQINWL